MTSPTLPVTSHLAVNVTTPRLSFEVHFVNSTRLPSESRTTSSSAPAVAFTVSLTCLPETTLLAFSDAEVIPSPAFI